MKRKAVALTTALLITLLLIASVPSLKATSEPPQLEWSKTYGPVEGQSVIQTADGGYALAGNEAVWYVPRASGDWVNSTFLLIKTDASGNVQWKKTYNSEGCHSQAYSVVQTKDGGYALAGTLMNWSVENATFWFVKTDANGNMQWNKTYLTPWSYTPRCVAIQTRDGGYALAGTEAQNPPDFTAHLIKVDADGNIIWTLESSVSYAEISLVESVDGDLVMAGSGRFSEGGTHLCNGAAWAIKASSDGVVQWNATYEAYSTIGPENVFSICNAFDGGYLISGIARSPPRTDVDNNAFLLKIDSNGVQQWIKVYENGTGTGFTSAVQANGDGYIAVGSSLFYSSNTTVVRTDAYGDVEWTETYEGLGFSIILTNDGGYAIVGVKDGGGPNSQVWFVKIAAEPDTFPPKIAVFSPQNNASIAGDVNLTFAVNEDASWTGYSLDGQDNVTVTGNTTLTGLNIGWHNLTVFAEDAFGNYGASETVTFSVAEPFPAPLIVAAAAAATAIVIITAVLLIYFKKRKH